MDYRLREFQNPLFSCARGVSLQTRSLPPFKNVLVRRIFGPLFAASAMMVLPAAAEVSSLPAGAILCSSQNGTCTLPAVSTGATSTVYFGAGNRYTYKQGVIGSIGCNTTVFGGDPTTGAANSCYYVSVGSVTSLPSGATHCASAETGTCIVPSGMTATVYYGALGSYLFKDGVTGPISCKEASFGAAPQNLASLSCYYVAQGSASACSIIQGAYSILVSGFNANGYDVRLTVGNLNFNGACKVSGYITTSVEGAVNTQVATAGTYNQNSDGTFTISLQPGTGPTQTFAVGYSRISHEMIGNEIDPNNPTVTASVDLQATSTTGATIAYSDATLEGTWSASCLSSSGFTDLNYIVFDGAGNIKATSQDYWNNSGDIGHWPYNGTYSVSTVDGEFYGTVYVGAVTGQNPYSYWGAITNNTNEIQFFYWQNGAGVTSCTGKRN